MCFNQARGNYDACPFRLSAEFRIFKVLSLSCTLIPVGRVFIEPEFMKSIWATPQAMMVKINYEYHIIRIAVGIAPRND